MGVRNKEKTNYNVTRFEERDGQGFSPVSKEKSSLLSRKNKKKILSNILALPNKDGGKKEATAQIIPTFFAFFFLI